MICRFLVTGLGLLSCLINIYVIPYLINTLNIPITLISLFAGCCQSRNSWTRKKRIAIILKKRELVELQLNSIII